MDLTTPNHLGPGTTPQISAVVCTYRREASLCRTITDLLAQTGVHIEIIVVDQTDRHDPETNAFLGRRAEHLTHIYVAEPNLPNARNVGLLAARGKIVVFVDDDVRVPHDLSLNILEYFADAEVDGIAPVVEVEGMPHAATTPPQRIPRVGPPGRRRARVENVIGACIAVRRDIAREIGGFDVLIGRLNRSASGEDLDFCRRFTAAGHRLWVATDLHVVHDAFTPGGCDVRTGPNADAALHQLRANTYFILKEECAFDRLNLKAAYRLARSHVINRSVISRGPRAVAEAVRGIIPMVRDVRGFWQREHELNKSGSKAAQSTI
jgi:GT2 family glycosyltransferase